jgi:FKBP-type peptidyl-prolyl cis-trans isomerase
MKRFVLLAAVAAALTMSCQQGTPRDGGGSGSAKPGGIIPKSGVPTKTATPVTPNKAPQVPAPADLKTPPADATKTASGLIYKKANSVAEGVVAGKNDSVTLHYTGWKQSNGETIFSTRTRGQPAPMTVANAAPGLSEVLQLLAKGERATVWVPPTLAEKSASSAGETVVYDIEIIEVKQAPKTPVDVAGPPASAKKLASGTSYLVMNGGEGDIARPYDDVTFNYTVWDSTGKMMDSSETRNRPATAPPYKMPPGLGDVLVTMNKGQRNRFWIDADKMGGPADGPGGQLCFELQVVDVKKPAAEPPPVPKDVAAPPKDAKKTEKGVSYKVLTAGKGTATPKAIDTVKVHYAGWSVDGKMFDTSRISGQPSTFSLNGVIAGWTDGLQVMHVGDTVRFWIPEELAYKGNPAKPQGMLVFDIELLEIVALKVESDGLGAKLPTPAVPPAQ